MLTPGESFLLETPPKGKHLFIIVAITDDKKYLCFNFTTYKIGKDSSCVIAPSHGCPPFIKRESSVDYKHAKEIDPKVIDKLIFQGKCFSKGRFSAHILEKVQRGALRSKRTPNKHKTLIRDILNS